VRPRYQDTYQDGPVGLATGIEKEIGRLVLRLIAGMIGVGEYSDKALQTELRKHFRDIPKIALDKACQDETWIKGHCRLHEHV
jgi:hypothetical protein